MKQQNIKQAVKKFKREFSLDSCNYVTLRDSIEKQGFIVIEFNHIYNDEPVQTLIDKLAIKENILRSKGFTYANRNFRIVFVHEDLSETEKTLVLAHELGHIFLEHFKVQPVIGKDVQDEYEANEFAHYLLSNKFENRLFMMVKRNKKKIFAILLIFIILGAGLSIYIHYQHESLFTDYYVTETGNKYHDKSCKYIKGKENIHRLTKDELKNDDYDPCKVCQP